MVTCIVLVNSHQNFTEIYHPIAVITSITWSQLNVFCRVHPHPLISKHLPLRWLLKIVPHQDQTVRSWTNYSFIHLIKALRFFEITLQHFLTFNFLFCVQQNALSGKRACDIYLQLPECSRDFRQFLEQSSHLLQVYQCLNSSIHGWVLLLFGISFLLQTFHSPLFHTKIQ